MASPDKNAAKQTAWRLRQKALGLTAVTVWVHECQAADLTIAADNLKANRDLTISTLRNSVTGRICAIK